LKRLYVIPKVGADRTHRSTDGSTQAQEAR
jgi:hypothetical protein